MGAVDFKVSVSQERTLLDDYQKEEGEIRAHFSEAINMIASEMKENLQKHIYEDWYLPWGKPKRYKRRTDNPDLGTPLGSDQNIHAIPSKDTLEFIYDPSGEHTNEKYHTRDGDDLIRVIQMNSGWTWQPNEDRGGREIMPRPFWNNFVDEQESGGIINAFIAGMAPYKVIAEGKDKDVVLDGTERL